MIRHLTPEEVYIGIDGGYRFFTEGKLPGKFIPEVWLANWQRLIVDRRGAIIAMFEDGSGEYMGAIGAVLAPDLCNNDIIAVECFWFLFEKYRGGGNGKLLLDEFEKWARGRNAVRCAMIHLTNLHPKELAGFYRHMGYAEVESHFLKDLS